MSLCVTEGPLDVVIGHYQRFTKRYPMVLYVVAPLWPAFGLPMRIGMRMVDTLPEYVILRYDQTM